MEGEEVKKERPQNKNLKPLGRGNLTPEEELEIRRKGKKAADKARKRNANIRAAVQVYANLRTKGKGTSVQMEKMKTLDEVFKEDAPQIMLLVHTQFAKALNGDPEARDWICRMLGVEGIVQGAAQGLMVTADADAISESGGVRIHLIRGSKPQEEESEEDMATRAASRVSMVEALKAIGEAAKEHIEPEGVNPDE